MRYVTWGSQNIASSLRKKGPEYATLGETITYTFIISNTESTEMIHFTLEDDLPDATTFVENSLKVNGVPVSGDPSAAGGVDLGNLNPGVSTVTFDVVITTVPKPNRMQNAGIGIYLHQCNIGCPSCERSLKSNVVVTTVNYGGLEGVKAVDKDYAKIADTLDYTIVLTNTGNMSINQIILIDTIPEGTSLIPGTLTQDGVPISGSPNPPGIILPATIEMDEVSTINFSVTVESLPTDGMAKNNATLNFFFVQDARGRVNANPDAPSSAQGTISTNTVITMINEAIIDNGQGFLKSVNTDFAEVGDRLIYMLTVQNTGNAPAENVVITDTIPEGAVFVTDSVMVNGIGQPGVDPELTGINLGTLAPSQLAIITFDIIVTTLPVPNRVANDATASFDYLLNPSDPKSMILGTGNSNEVVTTINKIPSTLTKLAPHYAGVGETITYTFVVDNNTQMDMSTFVLYDTIPDFTKFVEGSLTVNGVAQAGNPSWPTGVTIGDLGKGMSTITFDVAMTTIPTKGVLSNAGTGIYLYQCGGTIPSCARSLNSNTVATTINNGSLIAGKAVDKAFAKLGDTLVYTIVAANTGNITIDKVIFIDTIPDGTSLVPNTFTQDGMPITGSPNPPGVQLPSAIVAGGISTITFNVSIDQVPEAFKITNDATLDYFYTINPIGGGTQEGTASTNTVATMINEAIIDNGNGFLKEVNTTFAEVGDKLIYEFTVQNVGNATANNVVITDTIPTGAAFVTDSVVVNGVTQPGVDPQLTGIKLGTLAPNQVASIGFEVIVPMVPDPNVIANDATANFDYLLDPTDPTSTIPGTGNSNEVVTTINNVPSTLTKLAANYVGVTDTITYTLVVNNNTKAVMTGFVLYDTIPDFTVFLADSLMVNGVAQAGNPSWPDGVNLGDLGMGINTINFDVRMTTLPANGVVSNAATGTYLYQCVGTVPTCTRNLNSNTVTTTINNGNLLANKIVNKTFAKVGDTLTYTIVASNTGNITIDKVVFIDTIPDGTSLIPNTFTQDGVAIVGLPNPPGVQLPTPIVAGTVSTITFDVSIDSIPTNHLITNDATLDYFYVIDPIEGTIQEGTVSTNTVETQVNEAIIDNGQGFTKTVTTHLAQVGDTLMYTLSVQNTGNVTANNVVVTDTLPIGTAFIVGSILLDGVSVPQGNPQFTGVKIGDVPPGQLHTITFMVFVASIPNLIVVENDATVNFDYLLDPTDPLSDVPGMGNSNTVLTDIKGGGSTLTKTAPSFAAAGDTVTYTFVVANNNLDTMFDFVLFDSIPSSTTFIDGSVTLNGVAQSGNPSVPTGVSLGDLEQGVSTITFAVKVNTGSDIAPLVNTGLASYFYVPGCTICQRSLQSNTVVTTINFAAATATKDGQVVRIGALSNINYTVVLKNTGNVSLSQIQFIDTIPQGTLYVPDSLTQDGVPVGVDPNPPGALLPTDVAPGATSTITFAVTVDPNTASTDITNDATVQYQYITDPSNPTPLQGAIQTNTATNRLSPPRINNLDDGFVKSVSTIQAQFGDTITYVCVLQNTGDIAASNVVFLDTSPDGVSFIQGSVTVNGVIVPGVNPGTTGVNLGNMAPGLPVTIAFSVLVITTPDPNPMGNTGTVTFDYIIDPTTIGKGSGTSNTVLTTIGPVGVNPSKLVDKAIAKVGETLTYTIVVDYKGKIEINNVILTDAIPEPMEFIPGTFSIDGITYPNANPSPPHGVNLGNFVTVGVHTASFQVMVVTVPAAGYAVNGAVVNYSFTIDPDQPNSEVRTYVTNSVATLIN